MNRALSRSNLIPRLIKSSIYIPVFSMIASGLGHGGASNDRASRSGHGGVSNDRASSSGHGGVSNDLEDLHSLAISGNTEGAKEVAAKNKHLLRQTDSTGKLPLHHAVQNGHNEMAQFFVKEHPQGSYALDDSNISPLYLAVQRKNTELVKRMFSNLENDDQVLPNLKKGKSIVDLAIKDNDKAMLQTIIECQPKLLTCPNTEEEGGLTPISYASRNRKLDMVNYLLSEFQLRSTRDEERNKDDSTAFHKASEVGDVNVLKALYSNSKYCKLIRIRDKDDRTALHSAAISNDSNEWKDVSTYLLSLKNGHGDYLKNALDTNQCTPDRLAGNKSANKSKENKNKGNEAKKAKGKAKGSK